MNKRTILLGILYVLSIDLVLEYLMPKVSPILSTMQSQVFAQVFMLLSALLGYVIFLKRHLKIRDFFKKESESIKPYLLYFSILFPIILVFFYLGLSYLNQPLWLSLKQADISLNSSAIKNLLFTGTIVGLSEESLYRGLFLLIFLYPIWTKPIKIPLTRILPLAILSAIIFTFAHINISYQEGTFSIDPYLILTASSLGCFQAFVFMKTKNLLGPIILHNLSNIYLSLSYLIIASL